MAYLLESRGHDDTVARPAGMGSRSGEAHRHLDAGRCHSVRYGDGDDDNGELEDACGDDHACGWGGSHGG